MGAQKAKYANNIVVNEIWESQFLLEFFQVWTNSGEVYDMGAYVFSLKNARELCSRLQGLLAEIDSVERELRDYDLDAVDEQQVADHVVVAERGHDVDAPGDPARVPDEPKE